MQLMSCDMSDDCCGTGMILLLDCYCHIDVMASIDKRMMIKTLKHFLQPYVGVTADNFDVSG